MILGYQKIEMVSKTGNLLIGRWKWRRLTSTKKQEWRRKDRSNVEDNPESFEKRASNESSSLSWRRRRKIQRVSSADFDRFVSGRVELIWIRKYTLEGP